MSVRTQSFTAILIGVMALSLVFGLAGCGQREPGQRSSSAHDGVIRAASTPVGYLAWRLAGDDIEVVLSLPDGEDPGDWQPDAEAIGAFQRSLLIVANGAGFEAWVETAALPRSRVVLAADGARLDLIVTEDIVHTHGAMGEHSHGGLDPHTWMDPIQAMHKAEVIRNAMVRAAPEYADAIHQRFELLRDDLLVLHDELAAIRVKDIRLMASHPAYNYLARRLGWEIVNFHLEPDELPENVHWQEVVDAMAQGEGPALMLWEEEPDEEVSQKLLDELGIHSVVFSPYDGDPIEGYLDEMRANVQRLIAAIEALRSEG